MNNAQVIIVGAGLAGLTAAATLRKAGVDVLCIDKKSVLGEPLACGEGVVLSQVATARVGIDVSDFGSRSEQQWLIWGRTRKRFRLDCCEIDRIAIEKALASRAGKAVHLRTACRDLAIERDGVRLETSWGTLRASGLILAHGPHYGWIRQLGLAKQPPRFAVAYGGRFTGLRLDSLDWKISYRSGFGRLNYFWIFPKSRAEANIGLGYAVHGSVSGNLKEEFRRAVAQQPDLRGAVESRSVSGRIPISGPIERTYTDRLLVCGDAAGMVGALGDGIYYALASGRLAGETMAGALREGNMCAERLSAYERQWRRLFGRTLDGGLALRDILEWMVQRRLGEAFIRYFPSSLGVKILFNGRFARPTRALRRVLVGR